MPVGGGAAAWIDAEDIAAVVATLLFNGGHDGHAIELSGPRAGSVSAPVALISAEVGRRVEYVPITDETYRARLRAHGLDDDAVAIGSAGLSAIRRGSEAATTDGVAGVLGCDPGGFEDYVRRAADAWRSGTSSPPGTSRPSWSSRVAPTAASPRRSPANFA